MKEELYMIAVKNKLSDVSEADVAFIRDYMNLSKDKKDLLDTLISGMKQSMDEVIKDSK